jgi:hypothetical protein
MRPQKAVENTGRMGFREPGEPPDGRLVVDRPKFWRDQFEEAQYMRAVAQNKRKPGESPLSYVARIAGIVSGEQEQAAKPMPDTGMSNREWNDRRNEAAAVASRDPGEEG